MPGCAVCRVAMTSVEENIRSSSFVRTQVRSPQKLWVRFTPTTHPHSPTRTGRRPVPTLQSSIIHHTPD